MFQTVPLSIIRRFSLYTQQWYISYRLLTAEDQDQDGTQFHPDPARELSAILFATFATSHTTFSGV